MSSFQDKMYNYKAEVPNDAWKKITSVLDNSENLDEFSSRIYNIEAMPPDSIWEKINKSLDEQTNIVFGKQRKNSLLARYAAAATVIGLIAFGTMNWLNKESENQLAKENNLKAKNSIIISNNQTSSYLNNNSGIKKLSGSDLALKNGKLNSGKLYIPKRTPVRKKINLPVELLNSSSPENKLAQMRHSKNVQPSFANYKIKNSSDRYITLTTPEGRVIRISQKWGDLACTVSGEDQDMECKEQLEKWRERLACSPLAPSSGNFLDILSMVNSLKENNP